MKDRIDPLIEERAPWLFKAAPWAAPARGALMSLLGYRETLALADRFRDRPAAEIMETLGRMLARHVDLRGLDNVPRTGAALIVANHPTGIADGIVLYHALREIRDDIFIYANADILRILPQFEGLVVPVEWRHEKRTHARTRRTLEQTWAALDEGRLGVIFPSGRLAKRIGLRLHERPWMASAAMLARRCDVPLVPVHIGARNSALFYLFDLIHPSLRDITLFHETLNKDRQAFRIAIGEPISPAALPRVSEDAIEVARRAALALAGPEGDGVPIWPRGRRTAFAG